ncbi:hypothetical protein VNO77_31138 [Canavalia gladiata]|uniref:Uncharacterized protein n=1 Tax=Canavalia gladiata TaxID=3824 RepID=A0AAN9Q4I7_CANGL
MTFDSYIWPLPSSRTMTHVGNPALYWEVIGGLPVARAWLFLSFLAWESLKGSREDLDAQRPRLRVPSESFVGPNHIGHPLVPGFPNVEYDQPWGSAHMWPSEVLDITDPLSTLSLKFLAKIFAMHGLPEGI